MIRLPGATTTCGHNNPRNNITLYGACWADKPAAWVDPTGGPPKFFSCDTTACCDLGVCPKHLAELVGTNR
jgi:hypothetical protein